MSEITVSAGSKTRTRHACACLTGTGGTCTATTLKAFAQGHDARMSSRLATMVAEGKISQEDAVKLIRQAGGGDLLVSKTVHSARLRASRGSNEKAPKAKKEAAPEDPKAPSVVGHTAEVFHGKRKFNSVVVRNAAGDLAARHRLNGNNCDHEVTVEDGQVFTK